MGNSLRCCLACVLPCGALDLIRIVHLDGHVDEITRSVTAGEILKLNPDHVLSKPSVHGVDVCRIVIVSPDSELKRGSIYFLIPDPCRKSKSVTDRRIRKTSSEKIRSKIDSNDVGQSFADVVIVEENTKLKSMPKINRRSRGKSSSSWTPQLECICEEL